MEINEILAVAMFVSFIALLFVGFPVAWTLAGVAIVFAAISIFSDTYLDTFIGIDWPYVSLIVDDLWRNYRLRTRETRVDVGVYERTFASPIRDGRTATCVGELDVKFTHRHDVFDIPYCPRVALRWR